VHCNYNNQNAIQKKECPGLTAIGRIGQRTPGTDNPKNPASAGFFLGLLTAPADAVASCVIAGVAGFAIALHASGGPIAGWGFGILAVLRVGTTLGGLWAAARRSFELHRLLMRLSYALTFGAVTLRLQIPVGFMLGYSGYPAMSVWLAYTSWIPNVVAVLAYSGFRRFQG
jgi:hypothetical protein